MVRCAEQRGHQLKTQPDVLETMLRMEWNFIESDKNISDTLDRCLAPFITAFIPLITQPCLTSG